MLIVIVIAEARPAAVHHDHLPRFAIVVLLGRIHAHIVWIIFQPEVRVLHNAEQVNSLQALGLEPPEAIQDGSEAVARPGWNEKVLYVVGDVLALLRTYTMELLDALWRIDRGLHGDIGLCVYYWRSANQRKSVWRGSS